MSIPLVQNNEKDSINTSIIAIKRQIERINALLGLSNSEEIDTSVFATKTELEDAVTQVETDLAPVDEVTADNMHSVTSNAVAQKVNTINNKFNGLLKYVDKYYGNVTVGSGNYTLLGSHVSDKEIICCKMTSWSSNTGCFNVVIYGGNNDCYLIGNSGVQVINLQVRFYYLDI